MTLDLDELERKAKAATPGPWRACTWDPMERPHVHHDAPNEHGCVPRNDVPRSAPDVEFIASANPAFVLALIERVRELERYKAAAIKTMDALTREYKALERAAKAAGVKDA